MIPIKITQAPQRRGPPTTTQHFNHYAMSSFPNLNGSEPKPSPERPRGPRAAALPGVGVANPYGDHRAACATTGVLRARAAPIERAVARICREAGARVAVNVPLSRMNLAVPVTDARQIEVLANDLPLWHGAQLAVDVTLVSPLGRTGQVRHASDANPGAAILAASQRKREHTYPEFSGSRRCHLLILGLEVGGRWGEEAADFLRALAHARARTAPALLRSAAVQAYVHRWAGLLSVAAQRALAETLLELPAAAAPGVDGEPPAVRRDPG